MQKNLSRSLEPPEEVGNEIGLHKPLGRYGVMKFIRDLIALCKLVLLNNQELFG